jgi:hypothetical protein
MSVGLREKLQWNDVAMCATFLSLGYQVSQTLLALDPRAGRHHLFGLITNYSWYRHDNNPLICVPTTI